MAYFWLCFYSFHPLYMFTTLALTHRSYTISLAVNNIIISIQYISHTDYVGAKTELLAYYLLAKKEKGVDVSTHVNKC